MSAYPKPAFTVDVVLLRWHAGWLEVLLIERKHEPFEGCWALPGGFVDQGEGPREAASRELLEETNTAAEALIEVGCFGAPGRDPRGWTVSAAFIGLSPPGVEAVAGDDARSVQWCRVRELPEMAFDHAQIMAAALTRLGELCQTSSAALRLLGPGFRTRQARHLYSQILGFAVRQILGFGG